MEQFEEQPKLAHLVNAYRRAVENRKRCAATTGKRKGDYRYYLNAERDFLDQLQQATSLDDWSPAFVPHCHNLTAADIPAG